MPAVRRLLLRLERAIDKNQDQRSKYPNDPTKFIDSEADLDAAIKALMQLSQFPALAYPELVKSETISLLIGLLSHENMDIVIDVVELVHELTDEDVGGEEDDDAEEGEENKRDVVMKTLIDKLVSTSNIRYLPETDWNRPSTLYWNYWCKTSIDLMKRKSQIDKGSFMSWEYLKICSPSTRIYQASLFPRRLS